MRILVLALVLGVAMKAATAGGDFRSLPWYAPRISSALLLLQASAAGALTEPAPRVVVFFVADDLGWNDLQSGGAHTSSIETPHIDSLRSSGVTLSQYYTSCVCSPSRGAFLTGRLPLHLGYDDVIASSEETGIPLDAPLLPSAWRAATGGRGEAHALGKWHVSRPPCTKAHTHGGGRRAAV